MTETKLTFQRYEKKYLLEREQFEAFRREIEPLLMPDVFFESLVCSIYYDSESYELIRRSLDKPVYKEKLRLRSYGVPSGEDSVFVELKKKYKGIVYKRRVELTETQAERWLNEGVLPADGQVIREIEWMRTQRGPLKPVALIACDRKAYVAKDDPELRFTFDSSIRWRNKELLLSAGDWGEELLQNGEVLMEIKMPESAPLWLANMLSRHKVFPTSFSKYGTCYKNNLMEKLFVTE